MCFGWRHRPSCASPRVQVSALSSAVPDGKKKELLRIDKFIKAIDEGTLHVLRALGPCALVAVKDVVRHAKNSTQGSAGAPRCRSGLPG